jgi:hypothetical protein
VCVCASQEIPRANPNGSNHKERGFCPTARADRDASAYDTVDDRDKSGSYTRTFIEQADENSVDAEAELFEGRGRGHNDAQ